MKKTKPIVVALCFTLVLCFALSFNPMSTYSSVTEAASSVFPATNQGVCGCSSENQMKAPISLAKTLKRSDKASNEIINAAKESLRKSASYSDYTEKDFLWNDTQVYTYNETNMVAVLVPANKRTDLEKAFLQFTYDPQQKKLGKPFLMKLARTNAHDDKHFLMTYNTLDDRAIVGIKLDFDKKEAAKIEYYKISGSAISDMLGKRALASGYWDCVQNCLVTMWNQMPAVWRWVCEGACGGCLIGQVEVCPACLSCLAGYGVGCGTACL